MQRIYPSGDSRQNDLSDRGEDCPQGNTIIEFLSIPSPPPNGDLEHTDPASSALLLAHGQF